jgi:probable F420-dependent oxidoreductase
MKFGLNVVPIHLGELAEVGARAEELGFESLWIGEHIVTPVDVQSSYPGASAPPFLPNSRFIEPFTAIGYLAAATRTIQLGTGVLITPLHSLLPLARAIVTADVLSGGRLSLGMGVGWMREEFDVVGERFSDRGRRMDEMLTLLGRLFTEQRVAYSGDHYRLPEMGFEPKPVQQPRPPFLIGGISASALRRAARFGDGWYGSQHSPETIAHTVAELRRLRAEHQRDDQPFEITAMTGWGQPFDADLVRAYADAGVDRLVVTPWARSSEAAGAIELFSRAAGLEPENASN